MSKKKKGLVSDDFMPLAIDDAEVIEIKSKYKPRSYVLIHPKSKHIESLGVKDYYFWKQLKGEKTLAQLKQDYYQKFKALPTQHITELTHKWLEIGLIQSDEKIEKPPFEKRGGIKVRFEKNVSISLARNILGPVGLLFCNPIASIIWAVISVISYGALVGLHGPLVFFDAFEQANTSSVLFGIILSLYICAFLRFSFKDGHATPQTSLCW